MKKIVLLATMLVAFPAMSFAAIATGTLSVSASVAAAGTCIITNGGTSAVFGNITPPISANIDTQSGLGMTCPNLTPYTIALSTGNAGVYAMRGMTDGAGNGLGYNIYTDGYYTTVWGDGNAGTQTAAGTGSGSNQVNWLYLRVPIQATPAAGDYSDTVTITVTY